MEIYVKTMDSNCDWITKGKVYEVLDDPMLCLDNGVFGHIVCDDGDIVIAYTEIKCRHQGMMLQCDKDGNII